MKKLKTIDELLGQEDAKILKLINELQSKSNIQPKPNEESTMFDKGIYYFFRKEYEEAAKFLRQSVQEGEDFYKIALKALTNIGVFYLIGFTVEQDVAKGIKYLEECAESGEIKSAEILGKMYLEGLEVEQDVKKAIEYYEKAVDLGDEDALVWLGNIYYNNQNFEMAFKYYEKASGRIGGKADYMLGNMYYNGEGVEVNYAEAAQYYISSASLGNISAMIIASYMLYKGEGISQHYREAACFLSRAIKQFESESLKKKPTQKEKEIISVAYNNLGVFYIDEIYVKKDYKLAIENLEKAVNYGGYTAALTLGQIYEEGLGVEQNKEKAIEYYKLAAENGISNAQEELDRISSGKAPIRKRKQNKKSNDYLI